MKLKEFIDKTAERDGTPINREAMMAVQGFEAKTTTFNADGSIVETNGNGETKTTTFGADGSIVITFSGEKTITKTIVFNSDGRILEVIS